MKHFLTVIFVLSFLFLKNNANACNGDSIQISVSGNDNCEGNRITIIVFIDSPNGPNGTFHWKRANGFLPAGFPANTNDPFVVINSFASKYNGNYTVTYTDSGGCTSEASVLIRVLKNPDPYFRYVYHCYGMELYAFDSLHTKGPFTYSWLEDNFNENPLVYTGSGGPGSNRTVTMTNANGCSAQAHTNLLAPVPLKVQIRGKLEFPEGSSTTLTATANYPVKFYMWYRENVKIINSTSINQLVITDTARYRLRVSTWDGCVSNSYRHPAYTITGNRIENDFTASEAELSAYPNPAQNEIKLEGLEPGKNLIYDLTGRVCKTFESDEMEMTLNITDLVPGIYFLKSGDQSVRIIKQ